MSQPDSEQQARVVDECVAAGAPELAATMLRRGATPEEAKGCASMMASMKKLLGERAGQQ